MKKYMYMLSEKAKSEEWQNLKFRLLSVICAICDIEKSTWEK